MIVCDEHKFIFIRPTRCGTWSTHKALQDHYKLPLAPFKTGINHPTAVMGKTFIPHEWEEYYKFTLTRNPWAWWVSIWWRAKESNHHKMTFEEFVLHPPYDKMDNVHGSDPSAWSGVTLDVFKIEYITKWGFPLPEGFVTIPIPVLNREPCAHYMHYYNPGTKALIAHRCARLIEEFGYIYGEDY